MLLSHTERARFACPNCGCTKSTIESRKYLVTTLRRCDECEMMFRAPTDSREGSQRFYNRFYQQGFTTTMPDDESLEKMKSSAFKSTPKDFSRYISVLEKIGIQPGDKVFDFGCSWGYGSWQFAQHGYDVWASEVGLDRAQYAKDKLDVRIVENVDEFASTSELAGQFDCFFSCHVIEHVPSPHEVIRLARKLVRPGGIFLSFTPNGSVAARHALDQWSQLWGEAHPNFIDDRFLMKSIPGDPVLLGSRDNLADLPPSVEAENGVFRFDLSKYELIFAARLSEN